MNLLTVQSIILIEVIFNEIQIFKLEICNIFKNWSLIGHGNNEVIIKNKNMTLIKNQKNTKVNLQAETEYQDYQNSSKLVKNLKVKSLPYKIVGSKFKRRNLYTMECLKIIRQTNGIVQFREVFAGSASISFEMMSNPNSLPLYWINDIDPGTANFWQVVNDNPEFLIEYIQAQPISKDWYLSFYDSIKHQPKIPYDDLDKVDYALRRMVVQKLSFSSYGLMGGTPIKNLTERWNADNLCEAISIYSDLMKQHIVQVTNLDFEHVIRDSTFPAVLYLDPVYYVKGNNLYEYSMDDSDHIRLSRLLFHSRNPWLLSYDDCPFIRKLYNWANIRVIDYGEYTNRGHKSGQKELIITKKRFSS